MMKASFVLVLVVILSVYLLVNVYVFIRGWQALEIGLRYRWIYAVVMPLLAVSFIGAQFLKRAVDSPVVDFFWLLGSLWLAALLYVLLSVALVDLVRLTLRGFGEKPAILYAHYGITKFVLFCVITGVTGVLLATGYYNATRPVVNTVDIEIDKPAAGRNPLTVVMAGDMHLGCINGRRALQRWVNAINAQQPDVVLLPGDVFDDNPAVVARKKLGDMLAEIKAPLGVYFAPGNHESYGNLPQAVDYLHTHRVQVLPDTVVLVDDRFYVAGRLDRSSEQHGVKRKPLRELTADLDREKPVFLLDHQPAKLEEAVDAGIDLQVSGHTHRGQLWPFSLLTKRVYELDWGYLRKGNTHFYVTQGVGTWGPPVRLGTRSEIVRLNVRFTQPTKRD
ncbi:MAG: metallophosphoesterase [Prevotellaceae bacterium]|jgi:predicted MPP superfamily phosphohydrolase|nr:metallophosphoesterase [Prevotellaceae bacterium]